MPAIKYKWHSSGLVLAKATMIEGHSQTQVLGKNGLVWLPWIGFICLNGARALGVGGEVKQAAYSYTSGSGLPGDDWHLVPDNCYLRGWWVPYSRVTGSQWAIYTLVDHDGWPMATGCED